VGMLSIKFTMLGDVALARAVSRYGDAVRNFKPVWQKIREDFHRIEAAQFDTKGGRSGTPWAQLSPRYAAWKMKYFPGMPLLQLTGLMWAQFAVGTGMRTIIEPLKLLMAPTMQYPVYHQQGTKSSPMRKVVALTEADKSSWMKMIHNYIYDKAREAHLT